ncbi:hypothetical protein CJO92_21670 (plasmid) [Ralstonia solanacearum]|uniref:Uncharacterized protein n=1 Tax=Ralstonia solanacearum TaxID=305 RepID=A0AAD0WJA2_RALSL|nr:hypothetical protein CJO77_21660 [Ralstonia solanacearum]AXW55269.1 hypothetical protein CJO92_21670 [Ralstonia solanacearum]
MIVILERFIGVLGLSKDSEGMVALMAAIGEAPVISRHRHHDAQQQQCAGQHHQRQPDRGPVCDGALGRHAGGFRRVRPDPVRRADLQ